MRQTGHTYATGLLLLFATLICCMANYVTFFNDHGFRDDGEFSRRGHGKMVTLHQARSGTGLQRVHKMGNDGGGPLDRASLVSLICPQVLESAATAPIGSTAEKVIYTSKRWLLFCALLL